MNAREFFEAVKQMRIAQKNYFATRTQASLGVSKWHEKRVDDEIDRVEEILHPKPKQLDLFNNQ